MKNNHLANWLQWISLGIMAIYAAFWTLYAAGDVMALDFSGAIYFVPVILILGMMYLCWMRPLVGGIVTLIIGGLLSTRFYMSMSSPSDSISIAVVVGGPFVLAGTLLIISAALPRPNPPIQSADI